MKAKVATFFAKNPDLRTGHHDRKCLSVIDM